MSTTQHGHDGNQVGCVDMLLTMVHLRVLLLILTNPGGVVYRYPPRHANRPISATLKVSEIRDRQRDCLCGTPRSTEGKILVASVADLGLLRFSAAQCGNSTGFSILQRTAFSQTPITSVRNGAVRLSWGWTAGDGVWRSRPVFFKSCPTPYGQRPLPPPSPAVRQGIKCPEPPCSFVPRLRNEMTGAL